MERESLDTSSAEPAGLRGTSRGNCDFEPIAVIGFSLKFPQDATSADRFWNLLLERRSTMTEVPPNRWNINGFHKPHSKKQGMLKNRGGHFIADDPARFDATFFSMTPTEAECMDPQQRFLLETSYHALENAGIPMKAAMGTDTSVYVGCLAQDYISLAQKDPDLSGKYYVTGASSLSMLANRLSWFYDFTGPSMTVDTACSGSLVALHLACQELHSGSTSMALVGGSSLFLNPDSFARLSSLNFLSPESVCYSFDERANGYARGEGFGVLVLKCFSQAIADGDTIRGIIRSTGCNQDGRTPGITQPSQIAQERLIQQTYTRANLDMAETRYFEAHGTGTPIGDPIEACAISNVFASRSCDDPMFVGTLKSSIGHLEGASGIAGVIKTILTLEEGIIAPNVYPECLNPKILENCPNLLFPSKPYRWPTDGIRRASVNAFGFGGTNAHVVIDDALSFLTSQKLQARHNTKKDTRNDREKENDLINGGHVSAKGELVQPLNHAKFTSCNNQSSKEDPDTEHHAKLLVLSAFDERGLARSIAVHNRWLHEEKKFTKQRFNTHDVSYTLSEKRTRMAWKSFSIAQELTDSIVWSPAIRAKQDAKICFLFTGQGAQWYGMGLELIQYPQFYESMLEADHYLKLLGSSWSIMDELYGKSKETSRIDNPELSQPICTALQVALVDLLMFWNVRPSVVIGHSAGEIAAAYANGEISRQSAWMIAYTRGLSVVMIQDLGNPVGAMVSVQSPPELVETFLQQHNADHPKDRLVVACYNSPSNVTVSGSRDAVTALTGTLTNATIAHRILNVDVAYHSAHMKPVVAVYRRLLRNIEPGHYRTSRPQFVSTVTGKSLESLSVLRTADYWATNLTSTVQFSSAMIQICDNQSIATATDFIVDIGPHAALRSVMRDILKRSNRSIHTTYSPMLLRDHAAQLTALECVGRLYCVGAAVDITKVNYSPNNKPKFVTVLPNYPFNDESKYWLEGRLSHNYRFREHAEHELIGTRSNEWNINEARWNNRIILDDTPYLRDHQVNGLILLPAAGLMAMAIEAVRQLHDSQTPLLGYRLRDVTFTKAVILSEDPNGTEIQFTLRKTHESITKLDLSWSDFSVYIYEGKEWIRCCTGAICVEKSIPQDDWEADDHLVLGRHKLQPLERGSVECQETVSTSELYDTFEKSGLKYGPTFKSLHDVRWAKSGQAIGTVNLHHWKRSGQDLFFDQHLIHPSTLDAILQVVFPAYNQGSKDALATAVPTHVNHVWISEDMLCSFGSDTILVHAILLERSFRDKTFLITAARSEKDEPCFHGELEISTIGSANSSSSRMGPISEPKLYTIAWKPDHTLIPQQTQFVEMSSRLAYKQISEKEALCLASIVENLGQLPKDFSASPSHLNWYVQWMKSRVAGQDNTALNSVDSLCKQVERFDAEGRLLTRVARNLNQILNGEVDALALLFADDTLTQYYADFYSNDLLLAAAAKQVDLLAHKSPTLRVLEVGAGTGSATAHFLDVFKGRVTEYVFTDVSPGFFSKAKERFAFPKVTFQVLDISRDPVEQGFELESFDLIIAANVLHATNSTEDSLTYCRKLLRQHGHILLLECVNRKLLVSGFIFGLLRGWWSSPRSTRSLSALLSDNEWETMLQDTGFSGVQYRISDAASTSEDAVSQIMIASVASITTTPKSDIRIIFNELSAVEANTMTYLKDRIAKLGDVRLSLVQWQHIPEYDLTDSICIFLPGIDGNLLEQLNQTSLKALRLIVAQARQILWVSYYQPSYKHSPSYGLVSGLVRTIATEVDDCRVISLTLEASSGIQSAADKILITAKEMIQPGATSENEYLERDGKLHIPRLAQDHTVVEQVFYDRGPKESVSKRFHDINNMHLTIGSVGSLNNLHFQETDTASPSLEPDEVLVEIKATGLNFRDVLVALGQLNDESFGVECAGVVVQTGLSPIHGLKVGDRVFGVAKNSIAKSRVCKCFQLQLIPTHIDFNEAATYPASFCTAYYCLTHWAHIQQGESILIHSGAGGFGQAAIQLAQHFRCEVYSTVGSTEKADFLNKTFQIPKSHIFSSRNLNFSKHIQRMTGGKGVDVILNSLAGEGLRESWKCIAPFGRFIELGKRDIFASQGSTVGLPMLPFAKNVMFASTDLPQIAQECNFMDTFSKVLELLHDRKISPIQPVHLFRLCHIQKAFRFMQSGKHIGKIVITMADNDILQVLPAPKTTTLFDPKATYIIVGAFGGIGKSIVRWMLSNGAKYFILPSRSIVIGTSSLREQFVKELTTGGARVEAPLCDITSKEQLEMALSQLRDMPPIKGCIQSAMVLQNSTLANMTADKWHAALAPKVAGSWNLHLLLPNNLDFFVMLSSQAGIVGSYGQSNYAAGCTYQDALAAHRIRNQQRAISIDLGMVTDVGYVAENTDVQAMLKFMGVLDEVTENDIFNLLRYYCDKEQKQMNPDSAQIITAIPLPAGWRARDIPEPGCFTRPIFSHTRMESHQSSPGEIESHESQPLISLQLGAAKTFEEAADTITEAILLQLSSLLVVDKESIDAQSPIYKYGVDSLVAVELRSWLQRSVGADITTIEILADQKIAELTRNIAKKSRFVKEELRQ